MKGEPRYEVQQTQQEQLVVERVPEVVIEPWWAEWSLQLGAMVIVPIAVAYLYRKRRNGKDE